MITPRPNFIDDPHFVDDKGAWRLEIGASKATIREFNRFMKLTANPFVSYERPSDRDFALGALPILAEPHKTDRKRKSATR